jgi:hypothetical protein
MLLDTNSISTSLYRLDHTVHQPPGGQQPAGPPARAATIESPATSAPAPCGRSPRGAVEGGVGRGPGAKGGKSVDRRDFQGRCWREAAVWRVFCLG